VLLLFFWLVLQCGAFPLSQHTRKRTKQQLLHHSKKTPNKYCEGGDLFKTMLMRGGALPEQWVAAEVLAPLLRVLEQMHSLGLLHRDIKPENIFLTAAGHFKLGDFGLAIDARQELPFARSGTLDYMAPEVSDERDFGSVVVLCAALCCAFATHDDHRPPSHKTLHNHATTKKTTTPKKHKGAAQPERAVSRVGRRLRRRA
jgi:serine/threonine protein kinase